VVELRVSIRADVEGPGRTPELILYRDGTIIRRVDGGARVTKVTFEARDLLVRAAAQTGLFRESGSIPIDPEHDGGFMSYAVELRTGLGMVHRSTPNAVAAKYAEASRELIALAERLSEPEKILPSDAWVVPASAAVPFVAATYRLEIIVQPSGADPSDPNLPRDVDTVRWPLGPSLVEWGRVYDVGMDAETTYRCGSLSLTEAVLVESALAGSWSTERLPAADWMGTTLTSRAQRSAVDVWMSNLLPDEVECEGTPL
jgi:hypothetical protein